MSVSPHARFYSPDEIVAIADRIHTRVEADRPGPPHAGKRLADGARRARICSSPDARADHDDHLWQTRLQLLNLHDLHGQGERDHESIYMTDPTGRKGLGFGL
jgi:DNA polymerase IIIc chi subunit